MCAKNCALVLERNVNGHLYPLPGLKYLVPTHLPLIPFQTSSAGEPRHSLVLDDKHTDYY